MKTPCKECPFARAVKPGALGGSPTSVYVGQVVGPFWLPCYSSANYCGKMSDVNAVSECHGAAIFRTNIGMAKSMPSGILTLPRNDQLVFGSVAEFYAHHEKITAKEADAILTYDHVEALALHEINNVHVRLQLMKKKES